MPPRITPLQHAYLTAISEGHTTTRQLMTHLDTAQNNVSRILRVLRDAGLVSFAPLPGTQSTKQFHLTAPLEDLDLEVAPNSAHPNYTPPTDAEVLYVAKLRNAGLIEQRLVAAHQKKYPDRPAKSVQALVAKAKAKRWCR